MKRIPALDGVRGIAILLVLIWHYFSRQIVVEPSTVLSYCARATLLAWSGVDLFFVLSGFLIAGILLDNRQASNYFRVFYVRRVCRIFPLYYLLLALFLGLSATSVTSSPAFQWLFADPMPIWSYATFTQNIVMGLREDFGANWLAITWSLAVEEQFYLLLPPLIFFLPRRATFYALVVVILTAPLLRYAFPGFHTFVNIPWRSDSLLSGAALALLVRWQPFASIIRRQRRFILPLFAVLLAGAAAITVRSRLFGVFDHFWLAALYALLVLIAFTGAEPRLAPLLRFPALVWLGQRCYGIYMFHQAVCGLLYGAIRGRAPQIRTLADAAITVFALGLTLLLAAISYRFFEQPILRLGHRYKYAPTPAEGGAPLQPVSSNA